MFPTLGHLINYLFGTHIIFPLPTYGFILVLAFTTGGIVLYYALKRKMRQGKVIQHHSKIQIQGPINYPDLLIGSLFYFIIAFKIIGIIRDC